MWKWKVYVATQQKLTETSRSKRLILRNIKYIDDLNCTVCVKILESEDCKGQSTTI